MDLSYYGRCGFPQSKDAESKLDRRDVQFAPTHIVKNAMDTIVSPGGKFEDRRDDVFGMLAERDAMRFTSVVYAPSACPIYDITASYANW